jgi:hypothetical protein
LLRFFQDLPDPRGRNKIHKDGYAGDRH